MVEIHLLEQLAAFAEYGTLSTAADKLHTSQPALTRSMKKLEDELDVSLFIRKKNHLELNETGRHAAEYARRGITANCIAPGVIDTGSTKKLPAQRQQDIKNMIPCHRFGKPEEVAYLAAFLASERAAYINGQQIHINGGWIR